MTARPNVGGSSAGCSGDVRENIKSDSRRSALKATDWWMDGWSTYTHRHPTDLALTWRDVPTSSQWKQKGVAV